MISILANITEWIAKLLHQTPRANAFEAIYNIGINIETY